MKHKRLISYFLIGLLIPLSVILGITVFQDRQYTFISLFIAIVSCVAAILSFESKKHTGAKIVLIAVMVALSVASRFLFAPVPFFKPVTAIVIVAAIYLGQEAGFMVGAFSALLSNFYFGQGPWTPFQMVIWGLIGFLAGFFCEFLKKKKLLLSLYGVLAGICYSFLMDTWSVMWLDGTFSASRSIASIVIAFPVTLVYIISNVVFLLVLAQPLGKKLERIRVKYGL